MINEDKQDQTITQIDGYFVCVLCGERIKDMRTFGEHLRYAENLDGDTIWELVINSRKKFIKENE